MANRGYGQFCGLARAAEVVGQRWTLLILRDLLVGPRRYSDLSSGLPGIPSNLLSTRLRELESEGLVTRELPGDGGRSVVYRPTRRAEQLAPALAELGRWGAATMREPRDGEIVTEGSLVAALRAAALPDAMSRTARTSTYVVMAGDAVAHIVVRDGAVTVAPGRHTDPDLTIVAGPRFRDLLAGEVEPADAEATGAATLEGDPDLLVEFCSAFRVPYTDTSHMATGPTGNHHPRDT